MGACPEHYNYSNSKGLNLHTHIHIIIFLRTLWHNNSDAPWMACNCVSLLPSLDWVGDIGSRRYVHTYIDRHCTTQLSTTVHIHDMYMYIHTCEGQNLVLFLRTIHRYIIQTTGCECYEWKWGQRIVWTLHTPLPFHQLDFNFCMSACMIYQPCMHQKLASS